MTINIMEDVVPDDGKLRTVATLANELLMLQTRLVLIAADAEKYGAQYRQLAEKTLPDAMLSAGLAEFTLSSGVKLLLAEGMSISVPKKNMTSVCDWLREHKHEDIIAHEVIVPVPKGKGSETLLGKLEAQLVKLKLVFSKEQSVHSGTLKALLKEQREKGAVTEEELKMFGAYEWKKAEIQMPKTK